MRLLNKKYNFGHINKINWSTKQKYHKIHKYSNQMSGTNNEELTILNLTLNDMNSNRKGGYNIKFWPIIQKEIDKIGQIQL